MGSEEMALLKFQIVFALILLISLLNCSPTWNNVLERRGKQLEGGGASDYKNFMAKKQKARKGKQGGADDYKKFIANKKGQPQDDKIPEWSYIMFETFRNEKEQDVKILPLP